jgi:short-subunit dehydrogenase
MCDRKSGGIINVASVGSFLPLPYFSVYAASKAFVLSFSEALWAENKEKGIKVLALCPGPTESDFSEVAQTPDFRKSWNTPFPAEKVVEAALVALESSQSHIVTGGITNHVIVNLPRFLPRELLTSLVEKQFKP